MNIDKKSILNLYKLLYRYGLALKYTDKTFYFNYIRNQFESVNPENTFKIETLFKKGQLFLANKRII